MFQTVTPVIKIRLSWEKLNIKMIVRCNLFTTCGNTNLVLNPFQTIRKTTRCRFFGVRTPSKGCYVSLLCNGYIWNFCCRWF